MTSWWAHRRPLPSDPYVMLPRYLDQVDVRYMLNIGVVRPLWRAVTKPWRHPSCRWPVKCDQGGVQWPT